MTAVIDSHLHLWDPATLRYPWLADEDQLGRPFLLSDLNTGGLGLAGPPNSTG